MMDVPRVNASLPEIIPDLCSARKMVYAPDVLFRKGHALNGEVFSFHLGHEPWTIFVGKKAQKFVFDLPADVADPFVFRTKIPAMDLPGVSAPKQMEAAFELNRRLIALELKRNSQKVMNETLLTLVSNLINTKASDKAGVVQDLPRFLLEACVHLASRTLLGKRICEELPQDFAEVYADVDSGLSVVSLFMPWMPGSKKAVAARAKKRLVAIFLPIIARRRGDPEASGDLLDGFMAEHKDRGGKLNLSDEHILWLINVLHWGAHHYPAVHAFWAGVDIMTRPKVLQAVLDEVRSQAHTDDISKLTVLRACLKESIRLHSLLALPRRVLKDIRFDGRTIKKGGVISVSPYLTHRDPQAFFAAETFCPSRWSSGDRAPPWAFIPGGGGGRGCIGMPLTLNMLTAIWATLFRNFDLEFANQPPQMVMQAMLLAPTSKVPVLYRRR